MATKNNIRSIRFSDELAELIDRQIGDTFTQKFENLVTKCVWELPNREKQLKDIEEQIKKERERLYRLERATEQLRQLENELPKLPRKKCNTRYPAGPAGYGVGMCYNKKSHSPRVLPRGTVSDQTLLFRDNLEGYDEKAVLHDRGRAAPARSYAEE